MDPTLWLFGLLLLMSQGLAFSPASVTTRNPLSLVSSLPTIIKRQCNMPFLNVVAWQGADSEVATAAPLISSSSSSSSSQEELDDSTKETHQVNLELAKLANQCGKSGGGRHCRTLALTAYDLLQNMTYPDTVGYNSVLNAFAKSAASANSFPSPASSSATSNYHDVRSVSAAERAQMLLKEMMTIHDAQSAARHDWYGKRDKKELTVDELKGGPPRIRVKPNVRSFSTVMDAWSRTGHVPETLQVLQAMEERYKTTMDDAVRPNTFSYNTVLVAHAKSRGGKVAAEQAQQFLEHTMPDPDVISYNVLLTCWARSGVPQAGVRAEDILRDMPIQPNAKSYATVMDAWSRSRTEESAARAHGLLKELQQLYDETGDEQLRPNCVCYSSVIHAYAISKEPHKAHRAYALLQEMKIKGQTDPHVLPNTVTFNSVLNACATSWPLSSYAGTIKDERNKDSRSGDNDDGELSLRTMVQNLYQELVNEERQEEITSRTPRQKSKQRQLTPDHFTFGTVLKACENNIFWDDPSFGITVFQEACRRGQVSLGVLIQLRQACPMSVCDLLPPKAYDPKTRQFDMAYIPEAWKRNVKERTDRRPVS
jgi:pentatricopeptide repeat protein